MFSFIFYSQSFFPWGVPGDPDSKESARNAGDPGSIPGSGRSPGDSNGNPLQYSCLENSMERGTWCGLQSMGMQRVRHDLVTTEQQLALRKGVDTLIHTQVFATE